MISSAYASWINLVQQLLTLCLVTQVMHSTTRVAIVCLYYCISPSVYVVKEMDIRNVSRKEWSIAAVQTRRQCITLSCAWPTKVGEVIIII